MINGLTGFDEEFEVVTDLMKEAGKILLDNYDNTQKIETKIDDTPVTKVDRIVSELIFQTLERRFPTYGILDEESGGKNLDKQRVWFVDPLDGTKEYIGKTGDFGIIVGLIDGEQPVFGVTYKPRFDEMAYAARMQGAHLVQGGDTAQLWVSDSESIEVLVSRSRRSENLDSILRKLKPKSIGYKGGSLKTIEVAKGNATLFLCPPESCMHLWDLCAPSIILQEAGGKITDVYGKPFNYRAADTANYRGVVATNRRIHASVLEKIGYSG